MAGNGSVEEVWALTTNDISKMTNPQLKRALSTLVTAGREREPTNADLLEEIRKMREEVAEIKGLRDEVMKLSTRLDDAYTTIHHQQLFLEHLDGKERRNNIIITGVNEENDDMGSNDGEKINMVLQAARYSEPFEVSEWSVRRLGQHNPDRNRPILITVSNPQQRDNILKAAKNLKQAGGRMAKVYVKKDTHPAIRKEYARIKKREKEEREKPSNAGTNVEYDWRNRVLMRDGLIIDRFMPRFF